MSQKQKLELTWIGKENRPIDKIEEQIKHSKTIEILFTLRWEVE